MSGLAPEEKKENFLFMLQHKKETSSISIQLEQEVRWLVEGNSHCSAGGGGGSGGDDDGGDNWCWWLSTSSLSISWF